MARQYMEKIAPGLEGYLEGLLPPRPAELLRMEQRARAEGFPIIGPACGHLCYLLARMTAARSIFELGSGAGYSTAWFARAVLENGGGRVHHTVRDAELSQRARGHLAALGWGAVVGYHVGEAVALLRETPGPFDLVFIDIDKRAYPAALPTIREKLRSGGTLIADNMLWHGDIFDTVDRSPDTEGIREFTRLVSEDRGWCASLIPIRDGMIVARKV